MSYCFCLLLTCHCLKWLVRRIEQRHTCYEAAQRIRTTGVHGVLIGRASFGNPWIFRNRDQLKKLLVADINPTAEDLPDIIPSREERLLMAFEHANVHAKLKGEDHYVEMRKHMG
jgi:tRNA-dihydrouridine synthase B